VGGLRVLGPVRVTISPVSSTRDQQLARLRARRRAERRRLRGRQHKLVAAVLAAVLVLAVAGVLIGVLISGDGSRSSVTAKPGVEVACGGKAQPLAPATRSFTAEPPITIDTKATYTMTLVTSCGSIVIPLEAAKAPHTVNLLTYLANERFYDGSACHRSVSVSSLTVLQCGDPTGTGSGQIGFTIQEENLAGATYPRGTLAMAKTSEKNSTGSQFFLVDKDSQLPPEYTVAGHISQGLDVLDKLMAVGNDGSNGQGDGAPKQLIFLEKVTVAKS
jgi:peptidyl-prolyl cis-trans isomerase B (cyclophilin B)